MSNSQSKRKKICFLTHEIIPGGIENVLIEALKVLHTLYDIDVVSLYDGADPAVTHFFPEDVTVRTGPFPKNKFLSRLKYKAFLSGFYYNHLLAQRYDYIISLKKPEAFACFSNRAKHYIYWCHNESHTKLQADPLPDRLKKIKRRTRRLYKNQDMVWLVNENITKDVQELFRLDNFHTLTNPINCHDIIQKAQEPCDVVFDKDKTNIVLLGRIADQKGFDRVVRIMFGGLAEQYPNVHIYIVGGGAELQAFQNEVDLAGLSDQITMLGNKENPFPYLRQASLFLGPSRYESFALVLMEAMLLKIPVITTDTTGARYVTQNGKYAQCIPNTEEAIQAALEQYLADPSSYQYSLEEAEKRVWQHDASVFAERLIELLEKCEEK